MVTKQRRHFQRIRFDCLVEFEVDEYRHVCELLDISLRGALIWNCTGASPGAGAFCKLTLSLGEPEEMEIIMVGVIAHKNENRIGIQCKSIDVDSITHLRRLVEHNLDDPTLLHRDLEALRHS